MTKTCKCCGTAFDQAPKKGRPFSHCENCRKLDSDNRAKVALAREKAEAAS